jgi:glutathione S-transferase
MPDLILHHYWESPYAEKIRRIFGFKGLAWKSAIIPMVAPKPDLTALTGGYRKTPVLQIGADIYCDTELIARVLERLYPEPTLHPEGTRALDHILMNWGQELFLLAIYVIGSSGDVFPEGFLEDRSNMVEGGIDPGRFLRELPGRRDQLRAKLDLLEEQLGDGRAFLLGDRASLADFSLHHPLFALRAMPATASIVEPFTHISGWLARMDRFGHGERTDIETKDALEIARTSDPATEILLDPGDPSGRRPGDRVEIVHESFGRDPVFGELVASSAHEIAVRRQDGRVGEVVVHLPRQYYLVLPA